MMGQVTFDEARKQKGGPGKKETRLAYEGRNGYGWQGGIKMYRTQSDTIKLVPINSRGQDGPSSLHIPLESMDGFLSELERTISTPAKKDVLSVESLMAQYGNWGEHEIYTREDWGQETGLKNTQRGYWDWVLNRVEMDQEVES